jgi:Ca2+:H+ antiporter
VTVSVRNKLDLALAVAVGSSIQIALFVLPFLVILGWIIGQVSCLTLWAYGFLLNAAPSFQPLSLNFANFEVIMVVISVIVVNFAISDGCVVLYPHTLTSH